MQADTADSHRVMVLAVVVSLLVAVAAGAYMLTCVDDARAIMAGPLHLGGSTCALHDGHSSSNTADAMLPDRPSTSDVSVSTGLAAADLAFDEHVRTTSMAVVTAMADPLCGRLLL